jgi:hypothetical protein
VHLTLQSENISKSDRDILDSLFYNDVRNNRRDTGYICPLMKGFSQSPDPVKRIYIESCDCPSARKFLLRLENCGQDTTICKVREALPKR